MSLSIQDARLLEGLQITLTKIKAFPLQGQSAAIRDLSASLLEDAHLVFRTAMEKESLEEVQSIEARLDLSNQRDVLASSFSKLYFALHAGILERKMNDDEDAEVTDLSMYLAKMSPSEFQKSSLDKALLVMDHARRFGDRFVPDAVAERVLPLVDDVVKKTREKRDAFAKEGAEAVSALAQLEQAREKAKNQYLAGRDMMSAALRLSDEGFDKLGQVFPPMGVLLRPVRGAGKAANGR